MFSVETTELRLGSRIAGIKKKSPSPFEGVNGDGDYETVFDNGVRTKSWEQLVELPTESIDLIHESNFAFQSGSVMNELDRLRHNEFFVVTLTATLESAFFVDACSDLMDCCALVTLRCAQPPTPSKR